MGLLDVRAGLLDQRPVPDARWTRGHAGHAAEAAVEVLDDGVRQLDRPVDEPLHQVDPPAGRVHLLLPERPVGRAGRQAETAMDAVGDQLLGDPRHTSTPAGSNCARTRSASATSSGSRGSSTSSATYATPAATRTTASPSPASVSSSRAGGKSSRPRAQV